MSETQEFKIKTVIPTTLNAVMDFHQSSKAFQRLTPPPIFIQIVEDDRESLTDGEIAFNLWFGPIPIRWVARHEPGDTETSFVDRMVVGPMAFWVHHHIFEQVPEGVLIKDEIIYSHKPGLFGIFTRLFFDGIPLKLLFMYRHWITRKYTSQPAAKSNG